MARRRSDPAQQRLLADGDTRPRQQNKPAEKTNEDQIEQS
jgi:hypothetical protein